MKKFKVIYQKNQKLYESILESKTIQELYSLNDLPQNIISISEMKNNTFTFSLFKNHKNIIYELFSQLDIMLHSNLTFSESIELLLESKQEEVIFDILNIMQQSLSSVTPIDEALFKYKKYIGETSLLFLRLGFENGNIKESIHSLLQILQQDKQSTEKLYEVLRYPCILILSLCISIIMIFLYVLPNFEFVFTLLNDKLPYPTKVLLSLKLLFENHSFSLLLAVVLFSLTIGYFIKKHKYTFDKILILHIPIVSNMMKEYYFYKLFLSISIIVKSKYQFQLAISNSKNIIKNLYIQESMENILHNIKNGASISEAFENSKLFDNLTLRLLCTADYTSQYESILSDIATQYKKRFLKGLQNFSSTIEPLLILTISLIVLWLILAIMLPIWELGSVMN